MAAPFTDGGEKIPAVYKNPNKDMTCTNLYVNGNIYNMGGSGVPLDETFLVQQPALSLPSSRVLTAGDSISLNDAGPGTTLTVNYAAQHDLLAVESLTGTGFATRTNTDTWTNRDITGASGECSVTNGKGIAGDVVVGLTNTGTAGTYSTPSSITTDTKGRVTSVTAGTAPVVSVTAQLGETEVDNTDPTHPTIGLPSVVSAGTTSYPISITKDAQGRITAITPSSGYLAALDAAGGSTEGIMYLQGGVVKFLQPVVVGGNLWDWDVSFSGNNITGKVSGPDLLALEAITTTGVAVRTSNVTPAWICRTNVTSGAGLGITNGDGISGNPTFALANDVAAVEALSSTGFPVRTGSETWTQRSVAVAASSGLSVTNGDGVSGNPTLGTSNDLAALEGLSGTGFGVRTATDTWTNRSVAVGTGLAITNGDGVSANPTITPTARGIFVNKSGTQTITANSWQAVTTWTTTGGFSVGGDFVTSTGIFTVPITGKYLCSARVVWALSNTAVLRMAAIRVTSGTPANFLSSLEAVTATSVTTSLENKCFGIVPFTAGDTVVLAVNVQSSSVTLNATDTVTSGSPSTTGIGTYLNIVWYAA